MKRLTADARGTMSLTFSQLFMGVLTIGLASNRGTEAYLGFHHETQLGHANFMSSKLAADHARAANTNANNNVISSAIMGPRFAVEADNISMIVSAMIDCPQIHNPDAQVNCARFLANYPSRMLPKLGWVRLKQQFLWGSLGQLSSTIDGIASVKALETVKSDLMNAGQSKVNLRVEDPSTSSNIWGGDSTPTACTLAQNDTLTSAGPKMPGSAFDIAQLMRNEVPPLPQLLVMVLPKAICGAGTSGGSGADEGLKLSGIPQLEDQINKQCDDLENKMREQISRARYGSSREAFAAGDRSSDYVFGSGGDDSGSKGPVFTSDVSPYVKCSVHSPSKAGGGGDDGYAYIDGKSKQVNSCTFDRSKCSDDKRLTDSADFLHSTNLEVLRRGSTVASGSIGLAAKFAESALGGTTHAPTDSNWNHADSMRACSFSSEDVNGTIVKISDAVRTIVSFGQAGQSNTLRDKYEFQSCGKWYFPDGPGSEFAGVQHDQQPFVAAWKYGLIAPRSGGGLVR